MPLHRTLLVVIILFAFRFVQLHAECAPARTLEDEFKLTDAVFVGRVLGQSVLATSPIRWMPRATESTFVVERMWKGAPTKTVRVLTCGGTVGNEGFACSESFNFKVGFRYVVFASGEPLATSGCSRTASIVDADTTLKWLAAKPSRTEFDRDKQ